MAEIVPSSNVVALNQLRGSVDRAPFFLASDVGTNWVDLGAIAGLGSSINSISYCGNGIVIAITQTRHILRSTDYGLNYSDLGLFGTAGNPLNTTAYLGNGIVLVGNDNGHIFRSANYGVTWIDSGAITATSIKTIAYTGNGAVIFGTGNGHIWRSVNSGSTWVDVGSITGGPVARSLIYVNNGIVILSDAVGNIYRSTNFGQTFGAAISISSAVIRATANLGTTIVLAGDNNGHIFRSIDAGITWGDEGAITPGHFVFTLTYFGNGIVVFGNGVGHIFRSADYGVTWTDLGAAISTQPIDSFAYLGDGVSLFGNDAGHIARSDVAFKLDDIMPSVSVGISSGIGNTSGTAGLVYQQLVLAGGTNITLSESITSGSATITIIGATAGGGGISGIVAGTQTATSGTIVWSNSNNVSFGMSNSSVITASAGVPTLDIWHNARISLTNQSMGTVFRLVQLEPGHNIFPGNITPNTVEIMLSVSLTSTDANSGTLSIGIYTNNVSTLSMLNSVSTAWGFSADANNTQLRQGDRFLTINSSQWSATPVFSYGIEYYIGYMLATSGLDLAYSVRGISYLHTKVMSGTFGASLTAGNTSMGVIPFIGTGTVFQTSILLGDLGKSDSRYGYYPFIIFNNISSNF